MRRSIRLRQRVVMVLFTVLILVVGAVARPGAGGAQYYDVYSNAPFDQLVGLQQAIQRLYQGENELNIYADLARFDTEANAAAGLEALNAYYLDAFAVAGTPIAFEPVEAETTLLDVLAYHALLALSGQDPYADIAFVQAQDGLDVYSITVLNYAYDSDPVEVAFDLAVAMIEAMAAAPDGVGTPEADVDGTMTGGAWSTFPRLGDEVLAPYGFTYSEDTEWFALAEATPEAETSDTSDTSELLYGDAAGLESVISRSYEPVDGGPDGVDDAYVEIAAFEDADSAATGFTNAEAALTEEIAAGGIALEPVEADVDGDATLAWMGPIEDTDSTLAVVVSRAGSYVVAIVIIGDVDADLLGFAEDLSRAVIDADSGDGEAAFDDFGGSSGGLWDKMPAAGDEVLQGMAPYYDDEVYP